MPFEPGRRGEHLAGWSLAGVGLVGLTAAAALQPSAARSAAAQDWPPFVLVAGLLLIGLVADDDGLFAAMGHRLARTAPSGVLLFAGAVAMVGVVTAVLNLDTSVAFLTPVLVYAARSRGEGEAPLLYGCLLLSNASSLFLPGSNLTNLIVLGHLHLSGGQFFAHMSTAALASLVVTAAVVGGVEHRSLRVRVEDPTPVERPALGLGLVAVLAATVLVVVLHNAAIPVAAIGLVVVAARILKGKENVTARDRRARCPGPRWPLRGGRGPRHLGAGVVRTGRPLIAPRQLGYGGGRGRLLGTGQQPARRFPSRCTPARSPLLAARRAQLGAELVSHRLLGLVPLVAGGSLCRLASFYCEGLSARYGGGAALDAAPSGRWP